MIFIKITESLCWTCGRAYAKKGRNGCEFHRTGKRIYNQAREIAVSNYVKVVVIDCDHYALSTRALEDLIQKNQRNKVQALLLYSQKKSNLTKVI